MLKLNHIVLIMVLLITAGCTDSNYIGPEGEAGSDADEFSCRLKDGTYDADVLYKNSDTGYEGSYSLEVEVEDCEIVRINFLNGGYLDKSHIDAAGIDEDGNATLKDDRGRIFDVHIEN